MVEFPVSSWMYLYNLHTDKTKPTNKRDGSLSNKSSFVGCCSSSAAGGGGGSSGAAGGGGDPSSAAGGGGGSSSGGGGSSSAADGGTMTPSIWDSVDQFSNHPIFRDALLKVKAKIEQGTLATSYDIVDDPGSNHRAVLLGLPGNIRLEDLGQEPDYGFTDMHGIAFNRALVVASTAHGAHFGSLDAALADIDGLSYSLVIQETMEHELAHLKNHHEKMNDPDMSEVTDEGPPLYKESGYVVQQQIRRVADSGADPRILEVADESIARGWLPPLNLGYGRFHIEDGEMESHYVHDSQVLTPDELRQHMNYSLRMNHSQALPLPLHRGAGGGAHDSRGPAPGDPRSSRARTSASTTSTSKAEDGEEESHQRFKSMRKNGTLYKALETARTTAVQVQFCNKNENECNSFVPSDDIYVRLTFTNPKDAEEDAYVRVYRYRFGRNGVSMSIKGQKKRYLPTDGRLSYVVARIAPGTSHTFFRKLCGGPNGRDTDTRGAGMGGCHNLVTYWTPEEPGTYTAEVKGWDGQFTFQIRE